MVYGKRVEIETHGKDRYKRTLGTIFKNYDCDVIVWPAENGGVSPTEVRCDMRINYNYQMIKQGYAWYYPFTNKNTDYQQEEQDAREYKRGLWADKNPIAPWEWRKQRKGKK